MFEVSTLSKDHKAFSRHPSQYQSEISSVGNTDPRGTLVSFLGGVEELAGVESRQVWEGRKCSFSIVHTQMLAPAQSGA